MPELQDIFRLYGDLYRKNHRLSNVQAKVMTAITHCRTAELGGHMDICENCGNTQISYNSCRNRHCPKCQTLSKEKWIDNQKHVLLNVGYFHVVFTVPDDLRPVFYQNQSVMYGLLFKASADTLQELASNRKYLGAKLGFTSILHTWGQTLCYHPHIHCIVPGGGLNAVGKWVSARKKFFIPVKVLSRKFRGKFLYYLKQAKLDFCGDIAYLQNDYDFKRLIDACNSKDWVVYCKPPFKTSASVVEYLGRYTHRVAISNNRILKADECKVTFKWRDYKDNKKWKVMTLSADEFIRRFLMHVLPRGFTKIRHYGLLAGRNKTERITVCKKLTGTPIVQKVTVSAIELIMKITGKDISKCPVCGHQKYPYPLGLAPPAFA